MQPGRGSFGESPLGRSLRELAGRRLREVAPGLRELDPAAWNERATVAVRGLTTGYPSVWALTPSRIVMASSAPATIATVCAALPDVTVVALRPRSQGLSAHVVTGGGRRELRASPGDELETLAGGIAGAIGQTVPPAQAVLSTAGPAVAFAADAIELQVTHVGGGDGLTEGAAYDLVVDDAGLHMCLTQAPFRALLLPWSAVERLRVDSVDEMQRRVSLGDVMFLGLRYAMLAGSGAAAIGYLSAVTAAGELILRTQLAPPQLRVRLSRFLVRHESPAGGGASELAAALAQVAELHASGALSDDEFAIAKRRILGEPAGQASG